MFLERRPCLQNGPAIIPPRTRKSAPQVISRTTATAKIAKSGDHRQGLWVIQSLSPSSQCSELKLWLLHLLITIATVDIEKGHLRFFHTRTRLLVRRQSPSIG